MTKMNIFKTLCGVILMMAFLLSGCEKSTWERQEQRQIDDFIKALGDTTYVLYPSGLYYIEIEAGTGRTPIDLDTVYFKYKAKFLDYVTFDKSIDAPYRHVMGTTDGRVVEGVDEGLRYMRDGGKAELLTPSKLAFGFEGIWQIVPGYTPVLWQIEIDSVKAGPGK
jgi:FKBP-type peptidyl-prolyl cis-trans isomerase